MEAEKIQEVAFEIILSSGDARTMVHEGFQAMRENRFDEAQERLEAANEGLIQAHRAQTSLLKEYASGENIPMDVLMVHAQDHLMTTMTLREVALEMLVLHRKIV